VAPFYSIDLNHVPAPFSHSFSSPFSPHSIHMYFRLQPFFLVRSVELHVQRGRLCWEVRWVEWITGAQRAPLCIARVTML
jgi:hypothetical protein